MERARPSAAGFEMAKEKSLRGVEASQVYEQIIFDAIKHHTRGAEQAERTGIGS